MASKGYGCERAGGAELKTHRDEINILVSNVATLSKKEPGKGIRTECLIGARRAAEDLLGDKLIRYSIPHGSSARERTSTVFVGTLRRRVRLHRP